MSRAQWTGAVAAFVLAVGAGGAAAPVDAVAAPGAVATVKAYIAAVDHGQVARACALVAGVEPRPCRSMLGELHERFHDVAINHVLVRGAVARGVVDAVLTDGPVDRSPSAVRVRVLLRRIDGRWRLVDVGARLGVVSNVVALADPAPASRAAALERVADDELVALSGDADGWCSLLAPSGPLSNGARCHAAQALIDGEDGALTLRRLTVHMADARHARLDVTVAARRARATRGGRGISIVAPRWRDTLYAVRGSDHRWRLLKPSLTFYRVLDVPPPADVVSPAPTATWSTADAGLPSLSELPLPAACRVPPALAGIRECLGFDTLATGTRADGSGLVAWGTGFAPRVRPVRAGVAAGSANALPGDAPGAWVVADAGVLSTATGAVVVETNAETRAARARTVDAAGAPAGPVHLLDRGDPDDEDAVDAAGIASAPDAAEVGVLLDGVTVQRLRPDGSPAAPPITPRDAGGEEDSRFALLPDGTLLQVEVGEDVHVQRLGADGRPVGPRLAVEPEAGDQIAYDVAPALAVDGAGRLLVVWREDDFSGHHDVLRAWVVDPSTLTASGTGVRIARVAAATDRDLDGVAAAVALPGGGWGVGFVEAATGASAFRLWAQRLAPSGAPATAPRAVSDHLASPLISGLPFGIAGDTVTWMASPAVAGVPQVRAAPLP